MAILNFMLSEFELGLVISIGLVLCEDYFYSESGLEVAF